METGKQVISERLRAVREVMRRERLGAFIFPSSDPHQSEYVADHWKGREWVSGFNGSDGTAVVTMTGAALWTDSRYFLSAEEQLRGTEYELMRLKMAGTPTIAEWIGRELSRAESTEVGIDGMVSAAADVETLIGELRHEGGLTLRTNFDLLGQVWRDRPPLPQGMVEVWPMEYAGESAHDKLQRIRTALHQKHADGMLMAALDDIAWTLNLRGSDIYCTPLFVSYLIISATQATLYIDPRKLSTEVSAYLKDEGVDVAPYDQVKKGLNDYFEYSILTDPQEVNYSLYQVVRNKQLWGKERAGEHIVRDESPVKRMKTVKNAAEQAGFRRAMLRDGIAMTRFLKWLSETTEPVTEMGVDAKLTALRAEQPLFRGLSFDNIAAYGEHGAIVHYEATPDSDVTLLPGNLLLLDSGAQYLDSTTDITRTIAIGPVNQEQCRVYTLVLKGHIQLAMAQFPSDISGTQLDVLAKQAMWRDGMNYLHGTGHGVGAYLSVHEGPHQIRMEWKPAPLVSGMIVTNEPGIYLAGRFGVRIENMMLIVPAQETEFGQFLRFEPLTLCPIDKTPIVRDMLTDEEKAWLNDYHQMVYDRLAPSLTAEEQQWLRGATAPLE